MTPLEEAEKRLKDAEAAFNAAWQEGCLERAEKKYAELEREARVLKAVSRSGPREAENLKMADSAVNRAASKLDSLQTKKRLNSVLPLPSAPTEPQKHRKI